MAIDADSLLADSKCHLCKLAPGMVGYVMLVVLDHIRNGEPVSTDPQTLLTEANCLMCKLTPGMVPYATLAILIAVANTGAGGGVIYGTADPVDPPPGDSGMYYRTDTFHLWVWNSATATWDAIV
jgi:hypothetical protein